MPSNGVGADGPPVSATTLGLAATVDAAITVLLLFVGWTVSTRAASPAGRRALRAFGVWWFGLAVTVAANAIKEAVVAADLDAATFLNAFQYAYVLALCAAVWGLLYYLVYLFTGHERAYWPLATFYALYATTALWVIASMTPAGVTEGKWFVQWAYANPTPGGPILIVLTLLLLLPQIGAAVVYLRAASGTPDRMARFRVRVVAWSLILWLGIQLLAPFLMLGRFEWWQAGGRLVGLAAALAILVAYRPPLALARRLEVARG